MKIASGVDMLEVSAMAMGSQRNIYPALLLDNDRAILVDTGYPGQFATVKEAIGKAGVPINNIDTVIITHHDIDHIGGLPALRNELTHPVKVMAYTVEKPYVQGDKTPLKLAQLEANLNNLPEDRKGFYTLLKTGFQNSYTPVDETLTDGQVLPYLGGITVIHTPGHTLGHICLYLQASKTLIAGDTLTIENGELAAPAPAINYDQGLCRQSLQKLSRWDIDAVISYHGGLYRGNASQQIAALANGG